VQARCGMLNMRVGRMLHPADGMRRGVGCMLRVVHGTALLQVARAGATSRCAVRAGKLATAPLRASSASGMPGPSTAHARALLHTDGM
jgi:hypothetical protein